MEDYETLLGLNNQFIGACQAGSWDALRPVLSDRFCYVDGVTGEVWPMARYIGDLERSPNPRLSVDAVVVHVVGDTAAVSARTSNGTGRHNRYLDLYAREPAGWKCVLATVWPIAQSAVSP
jgi:hypothetical protein